MSSSHRRPLATSALILVSSAVAGPFPAHAAIMVTPPAPPPALVEAPVGNTVRTGPLTFTISNLDNATGVNLAILSASGTPIGMTDGSDAVDADTNGMGSCFPLPHMLGPAGTGTASCTTEVIAFTILDAAGTIENFDSGKTNVILTARTATGPSATGTVTVQVNDRPIPEPSTLALLSLGVLGAIGCSWIVRRTAVEP